MEFSSFCLLSSAYFLNGLLFRTASCVSAIKDQKPSTIQKSNLTSHSSADKTNEQKMKLDIENISVVYKIFKKELIKFARQCTFLSSCLNSKAVGSSCRLGGGGDCSSNNIEQ